MGFDATVGVDTGEPVRGPLHESKCELMTAEPGCIVVIERGGEIREVF